MGTWEDERRSEQCGLASSAFTPFGACSSDAVFYLWERSKEVDDEDDFLGVGSHQGRADGWLEHATSTSTREPTSVSATNTQRNVCLECQVSFNTGHDLELHAIKHRHRTFACPYSGCTKIYARRDACARHAAKHNNISKHPCDICSTEFTRKDHLRRHKRLQHPRASARVSTVERPQTPFHANADIEKVKASESALREGLDPDNLAIKMLDIASQAQTTEEGAKKAFAIVVACAALSAPQELPPPTKRRLEAVVKLDPEIKPPDLTVLDTMEVT